MTLMGGDIGCEPWTREDGGSGNAFWISLPATALPFRDAQEGSLQADVLNAIRAFEAQGDQAKADESLTGGGWPWPEVEPAEETRGRARSADRGRCRAPGSCWPMTFWPTSSSPRPCCGGRGIWWMSPAPARRPSRRLSRRHTT